MNYPDHIEQLLGFTQVKALLSGHCISDLGREYVEKMKFSTRFEQVEQWTSQAAEFQALLTTDDPFPAENYVDISAFAQHLEIEGYFLLEHQLHQIRLACQTFQQIARYFSKRPGVYPELEKMLGEYQSPQHILQLIDQVLNKEGIMKSNASRALQEISTRMAEKEKDVNKRAAQWFKQAKQEGWTAETELTIRNGRLVLPILAEHKRKIKGVVHDESSSGQVLYIEPVEIIEISNHLMELNLERRREIERILRQVTNDLRPHMADMLVYRNRLALFDFVRAKAAFSIDIGAGRPQLSKAPEINLIKAIHPILQRSLRKSGGELVPLNISLNEEQRLVVISGPNAGGKSVCLKTVGLLQYMLQCGLLVPASPDSLMGIFKQIFIDIGDGQSIESSLSTYSAHLTNMKHFLRYATPHTMILVDEMGTGTDPQFGGPLAEAILKKLHQQGTMGVVTTHYTQIKLLAEQSKGMVNAAMAYDVEHLQPLYRLEIGKPGSSFAYEVARKIGLPEPVISDARKRSGANQRNVDDLLVKLESEKNQAEQVHQNWLSKQAYVDKLIADYEQLKGSIEENRKNILKKAREEAYMLLHETQVKAEKSLKQLQQKNADLETARKAREDIRQAKIEAGEKLKASREARVRKPVKQDEITEGTWVKLADQDHLGQVVQLMNNKALVQIGELKTVVPLKELELAEAPKGQKQRLNRSAMDINEQQSQFTSSIDLRGKRGDEALKETLDFIDKALLLGHSHLRILHGKGDGILRRLIRDNLRKLSYVKSLQDEHVDLGGDGVTLVELK